MNLAFVVNNLGNSDCNYSLVKMINKIGDDNSKISPFIFYMNALPPIIAPNCLAMNISGLSNYNGTAVAIGIEAADIVRKNNSNTTNWLYMWDIIWMTTILNYKTCIDILKDFKIVARSESHKKIIENYTGRKDILIAEDMNELYKCLTSKN